jgi:PAS domain S-box-containing protein
MDMRDNRFAGRIINYLVRYPLPLAMVLLTVATSLLFYLEYQREEQRLVDSTQVSFYERLNSLELSIGKAVVSLTLAPDWATSILSTDVPEMLYRQFSPNLIYTTDGDYFSIVPGAGLPGNVFGSGKPTDRKEHFITEFGLSVSLLPWFRAAKNESDAIVQSYFVSETQICSAYPPIPPNVLLPLGKGNLAAAFDRFYEPHKGKQKNPARQPYFLNPYIDRTGQGLVVTYAHPIYYGERFIGIVAADITLGFLQSFTEKIGGLNARLVLVDEHGQVLTDSESIENGIENLKQRLPDQLSNLWQDLAKGNAPGRLGNYYVTAQRLENAPWTFIQIIDSRMLSKRMLLSKITFSIGLLVLIAFLSVAYFAIRRRRLEGDLRESELRYREVYDATDDAIIIHDFASKRILEVNRAFEELFGFSRDEAPSLQIADLSAGETAYIQADAEGMIQRSSTEGPKTFEWRSRRKDGTLFWTEVSLRSSIIGGLHRSIAVVRDITDRKRAKDELRESEKRFRDLVAMLPVAVFETDSNIKMTFANRYGYEKFRYAKADLEKGISGFDLIAPIDRDRAMANIERGLKGEKTGAVEYHAITKDGSIFPMLMQAITIKKDGEFHGLQGIIIDISDRKRQEEERQKMTDQLRQAQRIESIGRLAGGVAHDLNNMLAPIIGYSELLLEDFKPTDNRRDSMNQILGASFRARDLVHQLLAFSRKQTLEYKPANLNKVLTNFEKLLRRTIREDIDIEIIASPAEPVVMADVGQIEQVVMNLAVNAQDAMPEGGKLVFEIGMADLDFDYVNNHTGSKPGQYAVMTIRDNGIGMDEKTKELLFEPFYSTKGDKGTGLGLATVYGIIKQHDGNIWVYSEKGMGTTFKIYLPMPEKTATHLDLAPKAHADLKGSETILIAEDDELVRNLARDILERQGYTILVAESGTAALKLLSEITQPVHLLLTDVVMPEMNGKELYSQVAAIHSTLKVLFMSGYTDDIIVHHGVLEKGVPFIQKPFSAYALSSKVRGILDERKSPII